MDLGRTDRSERLDALAAEYALGTLSPRARRRLDVIARRDPRVVHALRGWEYRLAGLVEAVPAITPAPRVWEGIQGRLGIGPAAAAPAGSWWGSLALWRGLAAAGFALAVALGVLVARGPAGEGEPIVAVLAGQDARPALVVTTARDGRALLVKPLRPVDVAADLSLELWALPQQGNPRSLGVLPAGGIARLSLSGPPEAVLASVPTLAISVEPSGGSRTGRPTGPVLYTGSVQRMY